MDQPLSKIRVLLVDDDEDDFLIIRTFFGKIPNMNVQLQWIANGAEAAKVIARKKHDVYLIDYRLGQKNGLELLEQFNLVDRQEPFIILTGGGDERAERKAMKMGVADYLVKGTFDSELLARVIRHSMQRKQMEAQRMQQLMDLNRSKDEFIAIASHQLRTPATAVKQYVSMVLEEYAGPISEEQRMLLQNAYDGNERQLQIVNDILRIAKLDLEKIVLQKRATNMAQKVKNTVHDLSPQIKERRQKLYLSLPEEPISVYIDREYIRMALSNLLDNASKYTPEGKAIYISVKRTQHKVRTIIRDEGVGIAPADLDKLFKRFSRIDNPLSVKVGGTGLGLYWANEIIQLHGGRIDVSSIQGKGTTFVVTLPLSQPSS